MAETRTFGNTVGNTDPIVPKLVERRTYKYGNGTKESWIERWWCEPPALGVEYVVEQETWSPDHKERDIRAWRPVVTAPPLWLDADTTGRGL
jgi:hypothetical protein